MRWWWWWWWLITEVNGSPGSKVFFWFDCCSFIFVLCVMSSTRDGGERAGHPLCFGAGGGPPSGSEGQGREGTPEQTIGQPLRYHDRVFPN